MKIEPTDTSEPQKTAAATPNVNDAVTTKKLYQRPSLHRHGSFESTTHQTG